MERPFPAYEGTEPFIFVCYAHDDAALVYPEISRLREVGFHIWYDEGISPGSEWSETLAERIQQCSVFLFFVTPRSVEREHCRVEVNFAFEQRCVMLAVHLKETNVPPGLQLNLSHRQAILKYEYPDKAYQEKLDRALEAAALGRADAVEAPRQVQIGDWKLDVSNYRLTRRDEEHVLEPKDLDVLLCLAEDAPDLVTTSALLERSWPGVVVGDNALHQVIVRLRKALGDDARNPKYIQTMPRRGYRLIAPVGDSLIETGVPQSTNVGTPVMAVGSGDLQQISRKDGLLKWVNSKTGRWVTGLAAGGTLLGVLIWTTIPPDSEEVQSDLIPVKTSLTTIAVLPLRNISGDDDQDYLGDAISSEIWTKLTRVNGLRVISMTSSSAFRDSNLDIKEIGHRLTADFLVEGTAMQSGNIVRMNVHLSDVRDGTELWGTSLTKMIDAPTSLFALYDEISGEIGKALPEYVFGTDVLDERTEPPTHEIAAYNLVMQADYAFFRTGDAREALALANQAVELDPAFADAHSAVSTLLQVMAEFGQGSPLSLLAESEAAARRALDLDPNYGDGYVRLAMIYDRLYLDWGGAMAAYQKAEVLGAHPDSLAHSMQDILLNAGRYEEGLALVAEGAERNPGNGMWPLYIARFLYRLGHYAEAEQSIEDAIRLSPENGFVVFVAIDHLLRMGLSERAEQVIEQLVAPNPRLNTSWMADKARGGLAWDRGNSEVLKSSVDSWVAHREEQYVPTQPITNVYYELGDYENYMRWFEVRVAERNTLGWVMDELRYRPNYELKLKQWAESNPAKAELRVQLVTDHLALLETVTQKMVL